MFDWIQSFDSMVMNAIRANTHPLVLSFAWFFATVSWKGTFWWLVAGVLWLRKQRLESLQMFFSMLVCTGIVAAMKGVISRPRPGVYAAQQAMQEVLGTIPSFPSGHVALMMAGSTMLWLRYKDWKGLLAFTITLCVGFARVHQGMHWPTDVIASLFLGVISGIAGMQICKTKFAANLATRKWLPEKKTTDPQRELTTVGPSEKTKITR